MLYKNIIRPVLFACDAEQVHDNLKKVLVVLGKHKLTRFITRKIFRYDDMILSSKVDGVSYSNPVGLSAGFDKNGDMLNIAGEFGFGFEEVGSITGEHCDGNPKPRVHRAKTTGTGSINVWNGLNNYGSKVLAPKIKKELETATVVGGISAAMLNFNGSIEEGIEDYVKTVKEFAGIGEFLVVNISCPNTVQGEPFIHGYNLEKLLKRLKEVREETNDTKPWYVKLSPDICEQVVFDLINVCDYFGVNGIVTTNLTKVTNPDVRLAIRSEDLKDCPTHRGGMSGELVRHKSNIVLKAAAKHIKAKGYNMIILGVGGITTAEDAYYKIRNGASLLLLVTSFVFEGPKVVSNINKGLAKLLRKDGFNNISEAVGADLR